MKFSAQALLNFVLDDYYSRTPLTRISVLMDKWQDWSTQTGTHADDQMVFEYDESHKRMAVKFEANASSTSCASNASQGLVLFDVECEEGKILLHILNRCSIPWEEKEKTAKDWKLVVEEQASPSNRVLQLDYQCIEQVKALTRAGVTSLLTPSLQISF